ncbi:hypothetical protein FZC78_13565 [Rossellomorea vietnamensis]|uniref:Uncharacterized protein n=1 Tax=Rossellomorea vietnamensis TaxID=218284 RepID=A0A5D4NPU1_9BACI|nr:hypothetical protein [Rossellomorea vietnamensis]TYS16355.1 hypothetical protein FZC78_13565 [Rossellomorea vietnamensis]
MEEQLQQTIKELEVSLQELENARSENVLVQHYIQEEKREIQFVLEQYYARQFTDPAFCNELISYFWIGGGTNDHRNWNPYSKKSLY